MIDVETDDNTKDDIQENEDIQDITNETEVDKENIQENKDIQDNKDEIQVDEANIQENEDIQAIDDEVQVEKENIEVVKKNTKKWFCLRVISGKERKIKERIELEIQRSGWGEVVTQILVPTEKVYKIRAGKKVISERNILPGYILVEADQPKFSGEMITGITAIPNVIHFLGRTKPKPMQESEANRLLGKVDESMDLGESMLEPFFVGETVKIIDGPFNEFVGDIKEIYEEKKKLNVIVKIFGRGTEVELGFTQVEKQA